MNLLLFLKNIDFNKIKELFACFKKNKRKKCTCMSSPNRHHSPKKHHSPIKQHKVNSEEK